MKTAMTIRPLKELGDRKPTITISIAPTIELEILESDGAIIYSNQKMNVGKILPSMAAERASVKVKYSTDVYVGWPTRTTLIRYNCYNKGDPMTTEELFGDAVRINTDSVDFLGVPFVAFKVRHTPIGIPVVFGRYHNEPNIRGRIIVTRELHNYIVQGLTNAEISFNLGICTELVRRLKSACGVKKRKTSTTWQTFQRLYDLITLSMTEITTKYDVSPVSVTITHKRHFRHSMRPLNWFFSTFYRKRLESGKPLASIAVDMGISVLAVEVLQKRIAELIAEGYEDPED